jgi:hypothetical protein
MSSAKDATAIPDALGLFTVLGFYWPCPSPGSSFHAAAFDHPVPGFAPQEPHFRIPSAPPEPDRTLRLTWLFPRAHPEVRHMLLPWILLVTLPGSSSSIGYICNPHWLLKGKKQSQIRGLF